jgi:hypothetical protein
MQSGPRAARSRMAASSCRTRGFLQALSHACRPTPEKSTCALLRRSWPATARALVSAASSATRRCSSAIRSRTPRRSIAMPAPRCCTSPSSSSAARKTREEEWRPRRDRPAGPARPDLPLRRSAYRALFPQLSRPASADRALPRRHCGRAEAAGELRHTTRNPAAETSGGGAHEPDHRLAGAGRPYPPGQQPLRVHRTGCPGGPPRCVGRNAATGARRLDLLAHLAKRLEAESTRQRESPAK